MKVLKFGGTSVGSAKGILNLRKIVEEQQRPTVVVVSALGGVTDMLIKTARIAASRSDDYKPEFKQIENRHHGIIGEVITTGRDLCMERVDVLLTQLASIYQGVSLIGDLSDKTLAAIVSYGERLSSIIVSTLIEGSVLHDSRDFIKTHRKHGHPELDSDLTRQLVRREFGNIGDEAAIHVVPGFISADEITDETTNLGRGGSDYTASVIAAALDAEALEIWTDVNGLMSADPRVISTAYTIPSLSYVEAMELCNFGAKVVYPPTIYPVCV